MPIDDGSRDNCRQSTPQLALYKDEEFDVQHLLILFCAMVHKGSPPTLDTFKNAWQELHFSQIFRVGIIFGRMFFAGCFSFF